MGKFAPSVLVDARNEHSPQRRQGSTSSGIDMPVGSTAYLPAKLTSLLAIEAKIPTNEPTPELGER